MNTEFLSKATVDRIFQNRSNTPKL